MFATSEKNISRNYTLQINSRNRSCCLTWLRMLCFYATLTLGRISCEYECLKFAMNSPKCCDLILNMFSVVPKPLLTNILRIIRMLYQQYQWLTNCLRKSMANYRLHNVRSASYCCSHEWRMLLRT